jgi:hypothetical protein
MITQRLGLCKITPAIFFSDLREGLRGASAQGA